MGFFSKLKNLFTKGKFREPETKTLNIEDTQEIQKPIEPFEPIKTTRKEQTILKPKIQGPIQQKPTVAQSQFESAKTSFRKTGNISSITNDDTMLFTTSTFSQSSSIESLKQIYTSAFKHSGFISLKDQFGNLDTNLLNILINNRDKLSHRFNTKVTCFDQNNSIIGEINFMGMNPEKGNRLFTSSLIGFTLESDGQRALQTIANDIRTEFNVISASANFTSSKPVPLRITNITTQYSFA